MNTLQLYLLLDVDKFPSPNQERINFKLLLLNELCCRVKLEYDNYKQNPSEQSLIVLESISELIVEVVDRYYLIADGKLFLEIIMSD